MNNLRLSAKVTIHSSIAHNGDTIGIDAEFHRVKMMMPDGQTERIPTITGNSIRGQLRDASALYLLEKIKGEPLPLSAFYMLFSGGSLTKTGAKSFSLEDIRALRRLLPMLSLWGAAVGNHIMPGKAKFGMFIPIALETQHLIPKPYVEDNLSSVYDFMQTESYTRMDDAKSERFEGVLQAAMKQKDMFDVPAPVEEKKAAQQMRYNVETMAAGTRLYWHVHLENVSDIEILAFVSAFRRWSEYPSLGGKSAVGHGLVEIAFDNGWSIKPDAVVLPELDEYDAYLSQYANQIKELLYV